MEEQRKKWKEKFTDEQIKSMNAHEPFIPAPRTLKEVAQERFFEKMMEEGAPLTGYPDLDAIVKGFIPGHLYTLTGVENVGKSTMAANFSVKVANQGKRVLYISLEPENTIADYIASIRTGKRFDMLSQDDLEQDDGNIHIYGKEEVRTLEELVRIIKHSPRYDLVVVDHIGYFITSQTNYIQEQSNTIKALVGLAKEIGCAIMIIAHLRKRPVGSQKTWIPMSDDISGSGAFKQDSTDVMIMTRDLSEEDGLQYLDTGRLFVTKTKSGPNGNIVLRFTPYVAVVESLGEAIERKNSTNDYELKNAEKAVENFEDVEEKW